MLNAIQFPCLMVCSITMFGRLYQFCTKLFNSFLQMLSKSLVGLLLIAIPFFITNVRYRHRFRYRGQSMKQFRPGYFKTYQLLNKTCGDVGVLGITRLLDFLLGY